MTKIVCNMAISLDGFVAGPNQSEAFPFGERVDERLHRWMFEDAENNADELAALNSHSAYVMGRNMFGPIRGPWHGDWQGWWGDEPPYAAPVFVLTHHAREPLVKGKTTFTFLTEGFEAALRLATKAAGSGSVGIAGGADVARQALTSGVVDQLVVHVAPVVLGAGENLFTDLDHLWLEQVSARATRHATHITYNILND
ncbi:dihydrofolate reductase family protein [Devosia sediminis]|uniref:Dihydrofolate reductase family protein n=1 Tax=Devosia sediminis TaxID=2798801 RepID=A0A934IR64_9HYPH|nr:dihydrofolate reductase family protein [Devosia sediminis]MBJ3785303.1 dihydrofolate reductase family protein [Devosia sediminis]